MGPKGSPLNYHSPIACRVLLGRVKIWQEFGLADGRPICSMVNPQSHWPVALVGLLLLPDPQPDQSLSGLPRPRVHRVPRRLVSRLEEHLGSYSDVTWYIKSRLWCDLEINWIFWAGTFSKLSLFALKISEYSRQNRIAFLSAALAYLLDLCKVSGSWGLYVELFPVVGNFNVWKENIFVSRSRTTSGLDMDKRSLLYLPFAGSSPFSWQITPMPPVSQLMSYHIPAKYLIKKYVYIH